MIRIDKNMNCGKVFGQFIRPNALPFKLQDRVNIFGFCSRIPCPAKYSDVVPFKKKKKVHFDTLAAMILFNRKKIIRPKPLSGSDIDGIVRIIKLSEKEILSHPLLPDEAKDVVRRTKSTKEAKAWLIEQYYEEHKLIDRRVYETLFDHASREDMIIECYLAGIKPPLESLGIPSEANQAAILDIFKKFKPAFTSITDREVAFIKYLLLIHDIGKIKEGDERPHEKLSGEMLEIVFASSFNELTNAEKATLRIVINNHSLIDRIENDPENQQLFVDEVLKPLFRTGLSLKALEGLMQIWTIFRLAEKAQSEHFGCQFGEEYLARLSSSYKTAMQLAGTCQ